MADIKLLPSSTIMDQRLLILSLKKVPGLTASHLISWPRFNFDHADALLYLQKNGMTLEDAISKVKTLNFIQAKALTSGLSYKDASTFTDFQIFAWEEYHQKGLSLNKLRKVDPNDFGWWHLEALSKLVKGAHAPINKALDFVLKPSTADLFLWDIKSAYEIERARLSANTQSFFANTSNKDDLIEDITVEQMAASAFGGGFKL